MTLLSSVENTKLRSSNRETSSTLREPGIQLDIGTGMGIRGGMCMEGQDVKETISTAAGGDKRCPGSNLPSH